MKSSTPEDLLEAGGARANQSWRPIFMEIALSTVFPLGQIIKIQSETKGHRDVIGRNLCG